MSDIQDMITESVNRMFSEMVDTKVFDAAEAGLWLEPLWKAVEESGFTKVLVADPDDDTSGKWSNAQPVLHALGFHRVPLPLSETIIANALLAQAGLRAPDGPLTVVQQQSGDALRLTIENDRLIVNGVADAVPWARFAHAIVVAGTVENRQVLGLVRRDASAYSTTDGANIAGEPRDRVRFEHSPCAAYAVCDTALPAAPVTLYGALARAVMMAGAAQSALHQSVQYANERVQFGRPIGKFQAIQQSLAILAGEVSSAQSATVFACEAADAAPRFFDVAVAKIRAGQAGNQVANIAHQVHGAIGFTHEHTLHYATRRLWSWRAEFGAESVWAEELGRQAIAAGGKAFWSRLTASQSVQA
jgi:acyl-CoA dehydrogenase